MISLPVRQGNREFYGLQKKMSTGFAATFRNQCMEFRLLDMKQTYERKRLSQLGEKELEAEHRRLQRIIRKPDDCELYDDDISESDESKNEGYVVETSAKRKKNL